MMNLSSDILSWILWGVATFGTLGFIALCLAVPGFFTLLVEFLRPWLALIGKVSSAAIGFLLETCWEGLKDILDYWKTVVTVLILCLLSAGATVYFSPQCPYVSQDARYNYKLIKRTPAEKKAYLKSINKCNWWKGCF